MKKYSIALVDDSIEDIKEISSLISSFETADIKYIVDSYSTSSDLLILRKHYDCRLLDIDMPELSGFELADLILQADPKAVIGFVSRREDLVFDSFRYNAVYFVRKDQLKTDLKLCLSRVKNEISPKKQTYMVRAGIESRVIPCSAILYFEVQKNDLFIHLENEVIEERKTLKTVLSELNNPEFLQCHQSYIVNLNHVTSCSRGFLQLDNMEHVPVSTRMQKNVYEQYMTYLMGKE